MIGYTYLEYYIVTLECDDYETPSQIVNADNALYKTNNFKIIEIEDFNHKSLDMTHNYKKNTNYNCKIYFWINKQIAFNKKISDYIFYKDLHKSRNNSPRKIYPANSEYKPKPPLNHSLC